MKIFYFILLLSLVATSFSQNIEDAYEEHKDPKIYDFAPFIDPYNGEYQIFLDKLYWAYLPDEEIPDRAISLGMEIVSFPFIPDAFNPNGQNNLSNADRNLNMRVIADGYYTNITTTVGGNGASHYEGEGWDYGDYYIYSKVYNVNPCDLTPGNKPCYGDYGLMTEVYGHNNYISAGDETKCMLPHTVIKHTLYFHCGPFLSDPIIDSLSWIYDNTRGTMKNYPFIPNDRNQQKHPLIDVTFRPTFINVPSYWPYIAISNQSIYSSGLDTLIGNTGSVDYFPPSAVSAYNICGTPTNNLPLFYYEPGNADQYSFHCQHYEYPPYFHSDLVHPPSYMLLDAPLLNYEAISFAGYFSGGAPQTGEENSFTIDESFDLRIINPSEKIIYNPSYTTITCDLTFPCKYQFLTLRGKYADKNYEVHNNEDFSSQYWDMNPFFEFEYDKDYPVPVNPETNSEYLSVYEISGCTLTIEPYVIIMDAYFEGSDAGSGRGYIKGNLNHIFGNWDYDDATITIIPDNTTPEHCISYNIDNGGKTLPLTETIVNETEKIKILNGGSHNTQIKINIEPSPNTYIKVYNSFGGLILTEEIIHDGQIIDCSELKRGVYHAALIINGEIVEKQSFSKM